MNETFNAKNKRTKNKKKDEAATSTNVFQSEATEGLVCSQQGSRFSYTCLVTSRVIEKWCRVFLLLRRSHAWLQCQDGSSPRSIFFDFFSFADFFEKEKGRMRSFDDAQKSEAFFVPLSQVFEPFLFGDNTYEHASFLQVTVCQCAIGFSGHMWKTLFERGAQTLKVWKKEKK